MVGEQGASCLSGQQTLLSSALTKRRNRADVALDVLPVAFLGVYLFSPVQHRAARLQQRSATFGARRRTKKHENAANGRRQDVGM
jgi:hypothetical protein